MKRVFKKTIAIILTVLLSFGATIANFDFVFAEGDDKVDNEYAFLVNEQFVIPDAKYRGAFCTVSTKKTMKTKSGDGSNWEKYYKFATKDEFNNKKGDCIAPFVQLTLFADATFDQLPIVTGDTMLINLNGHTLTITSQDEYKIESETSDVYIVNGTLYASGSKEKSLISMSAGSLTFDGVKVYGKGSRRLLTMKQQAGKKLELHMYSSNFQDFKHEYRGGLVLLDNGLSFYLGTTKSIGSGYNEVIVDCYDCNFSNMQGSCGGVFELEGRNLRATFDECNFSNCKATDGESNGGGGAVSIAQGMDQKAYFYGCTIKKCTAPDATGGALLCNCLSGDTAGVRVYFDRCVIEECEAEEGGFLGISGPNVEVYGAIDGQNLKRTSKVTFEDTVGGLPKVKDAFTVVDPNKMTKVYKCKSEDYGGAVCVDNYFNSSEASKKAKISYFYFDQCEVTDGPGGAVCLYDPEGEVYDCTFRSNKADEGGGAIYIDDSSCKVTMCDFRYNYAKEYGGAIYLHNGNGVSITYGYFEQNKTGSGYHGGAIYIDDDVTTLAHCRFFENYAGGEAGALYLNDDTNASYVRFCGDSCAADDECEVIVHTYACGDCSFSGWEIYSDYIDDFDPYEEESTVFYHWGDCETDGYYSYGSYWDGYYKTNSFQNQIIYTSDGTDSRVNSGWN